MIEVSSSAPGWFGKLVMLGDFAHRRLPQEFVTAWDDWLSQCLTTSRSQLGPQWLDVYLSGPVWRFACAPRSLDEPWWFGVLMPSVDAVGRYFPLVVAQASAAPPLSAPALLDLEDWYRQVSQAALTTLEATTTLASFEAELARCAPLMFPLPPAAPMPASPTDVERFSRPASTSLAEWAQVLTAPLLIHRYAGHSFWWPIQATGNDDSMNVVHGLPDPRQFSLMLEGRW
jgi:type VI secretion system protein ImpM